MRRCPLCGIDPVVSGTRYTDFSARTFTYGDCAGCGLGLVLDPREDYDAIYDEEYYGGRGADPAVAYLEEMEDPDTIRNLEWEALAALVPADSDHAVLDFGCGLGGLVRTLVRRGVDAVGYEDEGFARQWMGAHGVPCLDQLPPGPTFDTVFAVEVVEHLVDPLPILAQIRRVLKPGGRLVITTGNYARAGVPLDSWSYASVPEVHVTFWTPASWARALSAAGFAVDVMDRRLPAGVTQYKILKSLPAPARRLASVSRAWAPLAAQVDRSYGVSEFADGLAVLPLTRPLSVSPLRALRIPEGRSQVPVFDDGWVTEGGDKLPFLGYLDYLGTNWSDDLEEIHEESSRDHFIDVLTREVLVDALPLGTDLGVIADLGCSTGYLLEDLARAHPQAELVGVDVVGAGLAKAHEAVPGAALLLADVCDLPLPDMACDAVVSANMLEHIADDRLALRETFRILKPGGTAAVVVPYGARLVDYYDRFLGHERRYCRDELATKAREAGFEIVRVDHLGQLLYPPFWLVKKRNRLLRGSLADDALRERVERDIAGTVNSALGAWACRVERGLVGRGLGLPVGIREAVVMRRPFEQ